MSAIREKNAKIVRVWCRKRDCMRRVLEGIARIELLNGR